MNNPLSVLLVDDHAVVRAGYRVLLLDSDLIGDVHEASSGEQACQLYLQCKPDIVVMDLSMPGIGGLETIKRLRLRDSDAKVLVFSMYEEAIYVARALQAGAKGYITKRSAPDNMIHAVEQVAKGKTYVEKHLSQFVSKSPDSSVLDQLKPREFDLFCLLARGMTTREASEELALSYKTAANYVTSIKSKLNVRSHSELTLLAQQHGLISDATLE
ncbi:MAG TPA: response regulator transcription factor [Gammaproteobacteria bacterium]|nr:response regulator transcription factor [Gammaproteobacteria bacterium]